MRGSVLDLFVGLTAVFAIAVVFMVIATVYHDIDTGLLDKFENTTTQQAIQAGGTEAIEGLDGGFLFIYAAVHLAAILLAFMVRVHPAFYIISLLIEIFLIFFSGIIADIYTGLATTSGLSGANDLTTTFMIFQYLPYLTLGFATIIAVVMHGKSFDPY